MSYELYITRADQWSEAKHWSEDMGRVITFEEWERLVEDDPELAIDYKGRLSCDELERLIRDNPEFVGCRTETGFLLPKEQVKRLDELAKEFKGGDTPDMEELGYDTADWEAHPEGQERCFWFGDGMISTKNPDVATLDKMLRLSKRLDACVRGDDGELYRRSDRGLECYTPNQGWAPLEEYHRGRPDWAPSIIRESHANKRSAR